MSRTSTLLFDLDDTLIHPPNDGEERLRTAFDDAGVDPFFSMEDFGRWIPKVEGESPLDLRLKCFRGIADEKGHPVTAAERVARAFEMPTVSEFTPAESATEVVTTLRERGYDLGLVTNGPEEKQREKLRELNLDTAFDAAFFGTPERGLKPDQTPFEVVLDELDAIPREAVKIGDSHEADIGPANEMGMTTVWFPPTRADHGEDEKADFVIQDLRTLLDEPWRR